MLSARCVAAEPPLGFVGVSDLLEHAFPAVADELVDHERLAIEVAAAASPTARSCSPTSDEMWGFPRCEDGRAGVRSSRACRALEDVPGRDLRPDAERGASRGTVNRLRAAVDDLCREGIEVRWLQSFAAFAEETYVWMLSTADIEHVDVVNRRADVAYDHVVEVVADEGR